MIYVTSDMHFGHEKILQYCDRPWSTIEEMAEGLIERWNETVKPLDHVWILGDAVMGKREQNLKYIGRLNGYKTLIPGNHDYCHPMHRDHERWKTIYRTVFADVWPTFMAGSVGGHIVNLSHFPYYGDHTAEPRHNQHIIDKYIPKDDGHVLLHGHTHGEGKAYPRQIDVGVDAWDYRPIPLNDLLPLIAEMENV